MKHCSASVIFGALLILPGSLRPQIPPPVFSATDVIVRMTSEQKFLPGSGGTLETGNPAIDLILYDFHVVQAETLFRAEGANLVLRESLGMNRIYVLTSDRPVDILTMVSRLMLEPAVEMAEPDYLGQETGFSASDSTVPNDTYFGRQWGFRNTGTFPASDSAKAGADIKAILAWPITTGDSTIVVAFLDSGVKYDHPEFSGRIWSNKGEAPGNGMDDDGNGYVDDMRGWNFAYGNSNVKDDEGHGTNVASIIGAKANNSSGYAGLDGNCKLMPLKVLDSTGWGKYTWWSSGLYYAANKGAKVINMSMGGSTASSTLETAVRYAFNSGCFIAASMGNSNDSTRYYPAGYDTLVVAVGATDCRDRRVITFAWTSPGGASTYGSWIDVCAPGNKIYGLNHKSDTDFSWYWSGTSQASPMVAGLAALLLAQDKSRTPRQLCSIIRATADDQVGRAGEDTKGFDVFHGFGRINCFAALTFHAVSTDESPSLPAGFALLPCYPNPFNPTTVVSFQLPVASMVKLVVYDILGREVTQLVNGVLPPGAHTVRWDAARCASGVYFCRLEASNPHENRLLFTDATKLVLVR